MIEDFSFSNFKSFKDLNSLNMTTFNSDDKLSDNFIILPTGEKVLKSKAIYGANASGKSIIIKALNTFISVVKNSVKDHDAFNQIDKFRLSPQSIIESSYFQLIFRLDNMRYRYGFEVDQGVVKEEWLFLKKNKREVCVFERESTNITHITKKYFKEGILFNEILKKSKESSNVFRNNSLFLTTLYSFGGNLSTKIVEKISSINILSGINTSKLNEEAKKSLDDQNAKDFILRFLKNADTGIKNIEKQKFTIENVEHEFVVSKRNRYSEEGEVIGDYPFFFDTNESEGTKKMFELSPFIYSAIKNNEVLVIDEFDAKFHPLITQKIIELFNSKENKGAQLIFVTHDTNLLSSSLLRRDQIDFVEKDKYGASHLYSLAEIKGVRKDASFEKDYIHGKYGAIPFLGNFSKLLDI